MSTPAKKESVSCPYCGSTDLIFDAPVRWDFENQDWVIETGPYGFAYCNNCDQEVKHPNWE